MKKLIAMLLCVCMLTSLLYGCASNSNSAPTAAALENPTTVPAGDTGSVEGEHVKLLRIGMLRANDTFSIFSQNGCFGYMNYNGFVVLNFWHFDENAELNTEGCFFRTWEVSADGRQVTLTYDIENLYWHDGVPVTEEDVIFSFEFWKKQNYPLFLHIESVEIPEPGVCVVAFDSPMAFSFMNQSTLMYHFMPKHIWESIEEPGKYDGEDASIGCGPYKLVNIDADAQVSYYEAVEGYPLGEITVDKVELHSFDNDASLIQAMMNNEIDVMYNYSSGLSSTLVPLAENDANINLGQSLNSATYQVMFGFNQYPTNQLAIRKAIAYSLDYELLRDTIAGDYGQISSTGAVSPVCLGYDASLPQNVRDLTQAAEILDAAGYADVDGDGFRELPDGGQMTIRIGLQTVSDFYKRNAEIIQINLAEAGIRAEVDEKTISDADYRTAQRMNGEYDLWLSMTTVGMAAWGGVAHYAAAVTITSGQRFGTYADPAYLAAYDAMSESRNYEEYIAAFRDIQRMNSEAVPVIAFAVMSTFFPYRTDAITGWIDYPSWGVINCRTWYHTVAK
jgi:peptide/nickel transport system substrate-binding protein